MMKIFPCQKCGICCKHIDDIPPLKEFDTGNGTCKFLNGNICSIYNDRPDICNINTIYRKYFSNTYTQEEFYQLNLQGCKELQSLYLRNLVDF